MLTGKGAHYDTQYQKPNYFSYSERLYAGYLSGLIQACGLKPGATVLDVGCGQGFFSYLFRKHGMAVRGIDISAVGIRAAQDLYRHLGIEFVVEDIETSAPLAKIRLYLSSVGCRFITCLISLITIRLQVIC